MSTLGWVALVLVVLVLVVALVLWTMARRARTAAHSPRTVADLVRLRAERADAVEPAVVPSEVAPSEVASSSPAPSPPDSSPPAQSPSDPAHTVVVPEPRAVVGDAPAGAESVDEISPATEERHAAPVRVPASADDTPWNRAARIAENAGIVWATDHSRPARAEAVVPPESVLRPVRLPAFPPDLVATRSTVQAARAEPAVRERETVAAETPAAEIPAAETLAAETLAAETLAAESPAAETPAAEILAKSTSPAEPGRDEAAAGAEPADVAVVVEPVSTQPVTEVSVVSVGAHAESAVAEPVGAEPAGVGSENREPVAPEPEEAGPVGIEPLVAESVESAGTGSVVARAPEPLDRPGDPAPSAPEAARPRRSPEETAAEQAAADLALLRTFGCADPAAPDDEPSTVSLEGVCCAAAVSEAVAGAAQTVAVLVVGRDGVGVPGAGVTLLDDRGGQAAMAVTDADGRGTVLAPHPGSYVLVSAANGHQPGAVAITVAGEQVSADLLLARSASLCGTVHGEDGPVVGARLTLVQDGEIVDTAQSGPGGAYRIADLAAGEYGLSVNASECEPTAVLVTVPDETEFRHDVELDPVGLNRPVDDVMIGLG